MSDEKIKGIIVHAAFDGAGEFDPSVELQLTRSRNDDSVVLPFRSIALTPEEARSVARWLERAADIIDASDDK